PNPPKAPPNPREIPPNPPRSPPIPLNPPNPPQSPWDPQTPLTPPNPPQIPPWDPPNPPKSPQIPPGPPNSPNPPPGPPKFPPPKPPNPPPGPPKSPPKFPPDPPQIPPNPPNPPRTPQIPPRSPPNSPQIPVGPPKSPQIPPRSPPQIPPNPPKSPPIPPNPPQDPQIPPKPPQIPCGTPKFPQTPQDPQIPPNSPLCPPGVPTWGSPVPVLQQIRELLSIGRDPRDPREEFLDVYTFGLGEDHDKILLNELASKKAGETHTFSLRDTEDLQEVFHRMIDESSTLGLCGVSLEHNAAGDRERNPWEATVTVTRPGRGQERCQGSLVSPYFVLTAAHCFRSEDEPTWLGVDIGSREHRGVRGLFLHPEFSPGSRRDRGVPEFYDFDVALVQLDRKVQPSSTHRPICIPCTEGAARALRLPERSSCQDHRRLLLPPKNVEAFFLHPRGSAGLQRQRVLLKLGDQRGPCEADALRAPPYANVTSLDDVVTPRFLCSGGHEPQVDPNACPGTCAPVWTSMDQYGPVWTGMDQYKAVWTGINQYGPV
uniref:Uncharacterized protein n=1 Tax=Geospiza parvula TaxID=87175 RepID=A0A8C3NGW3_GEOPR